MAEIVGQPAITCATSDLFDQSSCNQLFKSDHRFFFTATTGLTQGIKIKRSSDHRRAIEQLPAGFTNVDQPRMQQITYSSWQRPVLIVSSQYASCHSRQI